MLSRLWLYAIVLISSTALLVACATQVGAQTEDALGDGAADPVKLFEQAQTAHARGNLERALAYYEEAIKVKPEFPEAEFQKGNVLASLGRMGEAESALRRAINQRKDWSLPYSALGILLARANRNTEAETALRQALKLESHDYLALRLLASIRLRQGDAKEALKLAQTATNDSNAPVLTWLLRAMAERALGDKAAAKASLQHVLEIEPENMAALIERAELYVEESNYEPALKDLKAVEQVKETDKQVLYRVVVAYERAGKPDEAQRIAAAAGLITAEEASADGKIKVIGTKEEIEAANSEDPAIARSAIAKLIEKNPRSASLLARLGASFRTDDPVRSLEFYGRATQIEPDNPEYATGYAAALVRSRRFAEAAHILRRVISVFPETYVARANLATALYEQKLYPEAIPEYEWLLQKKPDLAVAYYFIASAHDYLGEYKEAQIAYEAFLARADAKINQLEIDKVNLRLPTLRRQIQLGQGVKRKP
ncbi:MAG: tetratricopeptide repeat protein [Acidobacteriota bacterium]|nr:tetratricopeptide repeat protein [Acidobacteriota bacterium]